jgi:hypothetical protein
MWGRRRKMSFILNGKGLPPYDLKAQRAQGTHPNRVLGKVENGSGLSAENNDVLP